MKKTEAQLSLDDGYHKYTDFLDKQDGVMLDFLWGTHTKITFDVFLSVSKEIEKWMETKEGYSKVAFTLSRVGSPEKTEITFQKYYVNFQHCSNACEHWVIVKCLDLGWPKIYTKNLGRFLINGAEGEFVKNQIFPAQERYMDDFVEETSFL